MLKVFIYLFSFSFLGFLYCCSWGRL